jgi:hypothetical protein
VMGLIINSIVTKLDLIIAGLVKLWPYMI